MNKNKRHIDLKMSSVITRTAHSRDRYQPFEQPVRSKIITLNNKYYEEIFNCNSFNNLL